MFYAAGKLSKALAVAQAQSEVSTETAIKLQSELEDWKKQHVKLTKECAAMIPAKEHISTVDDLKQLSFKEILWMNRYQIDDTTFM